MNAIRMLYLTVAALLIVGIALTGFDKVHWFLYAPVAMLTFAGITGICPGLIFWSKVGFANEACCGSRHG